MITENTCRLLSLSRLLLSKEGWNEDVFMKADNGQPELTSSKVEVKSCKKAGWNAIKANFSIFMIRSFGRLSISRNLVFDIIRKERAWICEIRFVMKNTTISIGSKIDNLQVSISFKSHSDCLAIVFFFIICIVIVSIVNLNMNKINKTHPEKTGNSTMLKICPAPPLPKTCSFLALIYTPFELFA